MNKGKKIQQALEITSEISHKVMDLRVVRAKMTDRQKHIFEYLIQGRNEVEVLVLSKQIKEVAGVIPVVTTIDGRTIRTTSIRRLSDLDRLEIGSYQALNKISSDHIKASVGEYNYIGSVSDIQFFFKLLAPKALETILEIVENKAISPQTRLHASLAILDRAGHSRKYSASVGNLPYHINIDAPHQGNNHIEHDMEDNLL